MKIGCVEAQNVAPQVRPAKPAPPAAEPCTKSRRAIWTVTACPGKKTEISMTMKGFDVRNLDERKRQIVEIFKAKARKDMARFLGLDEDEVECVIKAGSAIVVGLVEPEVMPDDFEPGNGENMLQMMKETDGVEELVEAGGSLDRCVVDPNPDFPINDEAAAVGDPHLTFATGSTAGLCCEGGHCVPCEDE